MASLQCADFTLQEQSQQCIYILQYTVQYSIILTIYCQSHELLCQKRCRLASPKWRCMKLPHMSVFWASVLHLSDNASEGKSLWVSHSDALLTTPFLALIFIAPPSSRFFLSNWTPTALPPVHAKSEFNILWSTIIPLISCRKDINQEYYSSYKLCNAELIHYWDCLPGVRCALARLYCELCHIVTGSQFWIFTIQKITVVCFEERDHMFLKRSRGQMSECHETQYL